MLPAAIQGAAVRFGDRPAIVGPGGSSVSYRALDERSDRVAATLRRNGLGEGSVIALTLPSGGDYVVAYLAAAKIGAITAGINPSLAPPEQAAVLARLSPDHIVEAGFAEDSGAGFEPAPPLRHDPERIVAVVFTSGTTGPPKGAVFRNRQLEAINRIDLGESWSERWDGGGAMLASTQFAHVGFMTKLQWYLRLGVTMHVLERWRAGDVLECVALNRIEALGVVAPQLALMLRHPDFDTFDLDCVSLIIAGGAASPPGLVREARERFGAAYSIRYSSTESGGVGLATAPGAEDDEALHTVGRPRPGVDVMITDSGELCLRSPAMFDGYWNDPETTATTLVDGWLHTGDLARIDDRGLVHLDGRCKEMYIRGGYNVAPGEVESVLSEHPLVAAVAISPRPDDVMGEIGVAVVVSRNPECPPSLDELRSFGADRLARWKLPEAIVLVDDLPLTNSQKLDRGALSRVAE